MSLAGKTVLVTGATGFLGGALALRLSADSAKVRALARRPKKAEFLADRPGVEVVAGDITEPLRMREIMSGCEFVLHSAAALGGPLDQQRRINTQGTRHVVEAAAAAGVTRLVHVSTISVYGYRQSGDVTEAISPAPGHDPYSISKAEAESVVREVAERSGLAYSIIRPGMIYGPRSGMWTRTLFNLAKRRPTIFLGSGRGSTFPIYVDDVVDLTLILATHPAAPGETFNCAPDPSPTWREFLGAYSQLAGHQSWLGVPLALVYPLAAAVALFARPQTQLKDLPAILGLLDRQVTYRMTKARDRLGWQPQVALATGIQHSAVWLRELGLLA